MTRSTRLPLLAAACGVLALGLVACGDDDLADDDDGGAPAGLNQSVAGTDEAARAPAEAYDASGSPGGAAQATSPKSAAEGGGGTEGGGGQLASQLDRKIIFNATLGLEVKDVAASFSEVTTIAKVAGGYVEKSSFSGGDGRESRDRSASITVRVPADGYQDTLAKLRGVGGGTVKSEGSRSNEITEQYTDLQSRLRNLQATEAQYLKLLEQAKTIPDILTVNDRLNSVRSQTEQVQGRLKVLDNLADLATIDVTLTPFIPAKDGPKDGGPKGVGEAFADAWAASLTVARYTASAGAMLLVVAIWLAVPAGIVYAASRFVRRRMAPTTGA